MTETGWGGPCFWRPTHGGCNRPGELRSKNCFERYAEDGSIVLKSGKKDRNKLCHDVVYSKDRVQSYTDVRQTCKPCLKISILPFHRFLSIFSYVFLV